MEERSPPYNHASPSIGSHGSSLFAQPAAAATSVDVKGVMLGIGLRAESIFESIGGQGTAGGPSGSGGGGTSIGSVIGVFLIDMSAKAPRSTAKQMPRFLLEPLTFSVQGSRSSEDTGVGGIDP